jgi:hypothetical protein
VAPEGSRICIGVKGEDGCAVLWSPERG